MDDNAHITDPALRRYLGLEPPLPVVEHPEITDNVLRKYLGLDAYNPNQPRDENGRWTSGNKIKVRYKRQNRLYKREYPPCGRMRLDSALFQSLSSCDEKDLEYTKYVIDYKVKFIYNDVLDYTILDWDFIDGV